MLDLSRIHDAVRYEGHVSRRLLLAYASSLAAIPWLQRSGWAEERPNFSDDPFALGVASGDPDHESVVLWTKLAPRPLEFGGGMPGIPIQVAWEMAEDQAMKKIVASGTSVATPQLGHSVHVEVQGLQPDRWYWYRFRAGDAESSVGRTRTLPDASTLPQRLKFAFTSCQHFEQGLFTAYEQMAADDVDLVLHLGDYIYEYEAGRGGKVRTHLGKEIESLDDYRRRYNQYRADPLLHGMHAQCPWMVTWDDHEFDNNCAADVSEEKHVDPVDFLVRRANAYQAYYEMMPLRARCLPTGPDMQLYRNASYGQLADFFVLDTRQYRTDQPNDDRKSPLNAAAMNPSNSLLGTGQYRWLQRSLIGSQATWNVLAQQVMMGMVGFPQRANSSGEGVAESQPRVYSMDQWPGYAAERRRLLQFLADRRILNPVVLTGDIHSNWANELRLDDRNPDLEVIAAEFVVTSLSSGGNGTQQAKGHSDLLAHNPCIRFHNRERGYVRCTLTPSTWTSDYVVVDDVLKPGGKCQTRKSFVVEAGKPHIHVA